jgi:hypothetical protein
MYKAIITKFLPCSPTLPHRMRARDEDGNQAIVSNGVSAIASHRTAAEALCKKMGWHGTLNEASLAPGSRVYVFVDKSDQFRV